MNWKSNKIYGKLMTLFVLYYKLVAFVMPQYHRQQNKCYLQRCQIVTKTATAALCDEIWPQ